MKKLLHWIFNTHTGIFFLTLVYLFVFYPAALGAYCAGAFVGVMLYMDSQRD